MIDSDKIKALLTHFEKPRGFHEPGVLGEAEVDAFEGRLGFRVPDDLREWLKISNGAVVRTMVIYGAQPNKSPLSIEGVLDVFPEWRLKKWIPVSDDGCGNYYVIATHGEFGEGYPVIFVEAVTDPDAPDYIVASDLGHFLVFVMQDELATHGDYELDEGTGWPFDEEVVVRDDPAILAFHGVRLPWVADKESQG